MKTLYIKIVFISSRVGVEERQSLDWRGVADPIDALAS